MKFGGVNKVNNYNYNWKLPVLISVLLLFAMMIGLPIYRVWQRELAGKAELAEATWNRKIAVEEAEARKASAVLDAQAEVERAKGVREAQEIISATLSEQYLRYLWIQNVERGENRQTIYIPTEAGLPILEADRFGE